MLSDVKLRLKDLTIIFDNSAIGAHGTRETVRGRGRFVDYPWGQFEVKFSAFSPWTDYKIIETDYRGYAVAHSCTNKLWAWTEEDTILFYR